MKSKKNHDDGREEKLWKTFARNIMPNGQRKSMCRKILNTTERKFMNVGKSIFFTTDIKILYDRDKK